MKYIIIIIAFVASYAVATGQNAKTDNKPIETGFVFIDGKYIEPPYTIEYKDDTIYINKVGVLKYKRATYYKERIYDHDPGIPPGLNKETKLEDILSFKEPITGKLYFDLASGYFYSHFEYEEAQTKFHDYLRSFSNVKNLSYIKGMLTLESYYGEVKTYADFGEMREFNSHWGPGGSGLPSIDIGENHFKVSIDKYKQLLITQ
ncbi:MAG: hypothetical protein HY958_11290 [Bacteroidia bacterium]|nr:hypothetical protein [Bacteroidia bacterium]